MNARHWLLIKKYDASDKFSIDIVSSADDNLKFNNIALRINCNRILTNLYH